MTTWTHRVHRPLPSRELEQMRQIAQELADHAGHAPGGTGTTFRKIADSVMIGAIIIGGLVSSVQLWKSMFPRHREERHEPSPQAAGQGGDPPRRRYTHAAAYEDDANRRATHGRGLD